MCPKYLAKNILTTSKERIMFLAQEEFLLDFPGTLNIFWVLWWAFVFFLRMYMSFNFVCFTCPCVTKPMLGFFRDPEVSFSYIA